MYKPTKSGAQLKLFGRRVFLTGRSLGLVVKRIVRLPNAGIEFAANKCRLVMMRCKTSPPAVVMFTELSNSIGSIPIVSRQTAAPSFCSVADWVNHVIATLYCGVRATSLPCLESKLHEMIGESPNG